MLGRKRSKSAPSNSMKLKLRQNGLGEKKVAFPSSASAEIVKRVLYA
jgi:hypothetical protein